MITFNCPFILPPVSGHHPLYFFSGSTIPLFLQLILLFLRQMHFLAHFWCSLSSWVQRDGKYKRWHNWQPALTWLWAANKTNTPLSRQKDKTKTLDHCIGNIILHRWKLSLFWGYFRSESVDFPFAVDTNNLGAWWGEVNNTLGCAWFDLFSADFCHFLLQHYIQSHLFFSSPICGSW